MKKRTAVLLTVLTVFMLTTFSAYAEEIRHCPATVFGCNESITLREAPSVTAPEICQIRLGEAVLILSDAGADFKKVMYNGKSGYVLEKYLNYSEPATIEIGDGLHVSGCEVGISLRTQPDVESDVILTVPLFNSVKVLKDCGNGFYQVEYEGNTGYVLATYLDYYEPQIFVAKEGKIVNCSESVTLRDLPATWAGEIIQIPKGALVKDIADVNRDFYRVSYKGHDGYVLKHYLEPSGY